MRDILANPLDIYFTGCYTVVAKEKEKEEDLFPPLKIELDPEKFPPLKLK